MALSQLPNLASRLNRALEFKPINVLALMERVGNQPTTVLCDAKLAYALDDLARWSAFYDVPFTPNPHLGAIDSEPLLLGALAADKLGVIQEYTRAVFNAYWVNQARFNDTSELFDVLDNADVPGAKVIVESHSDYADQLEQNITDAVSEGIFGVPSFGTEAGLFFGNDRLEFMAQALTERT